MPPDKGAPLPVNCTCPPVPMRQSDSPHSSSHLHFLPHLSPLLSSQPPQKLHGNAYLFFDTFWPFTNKCVCIGHHSNTSSQTNSRSLESESQGYELRFSFVTRSPKNSFSHLIWKSLHRLTYVLNSIFLLLANFSSFFKILKFCLLWEDTSTMPDIKAMLTHFSLSEYFIFIPLWLYLLHFSVWVLPFSMRKCPLCQ